MSLGLGLGSYDAIIILGVSLPALLVASRIQNPKLRTLSLLLAAFLVLHGLFHATAVLSFTYNSDILEAISIGVVQPLSYLVLLVFAYKLYWLGGSQD